METSKNEAIIVNGTNNPDMEIEDEEELLI